MNLVISVVYLISIFVLTIIIYKYFGKGGLFIWISLNLIVCNIQSAKAIQIFGKLVSLGNISYSAVFLSTDILNEKYGIKEANKSVYVGFVVMVLFLCMIQATIKFVPSNSNISQEALKIVFGSLPRVTFASLISYIVSQKLDTYIYDLLKKKNVSLWIKNNFSTIISQILDSIIFVSISFGCSFLFNECMDLIFTMIIFKSIIALLDTPFMYIANSTENINELL